MKFSRICISVTAGIITAWATAANAAQWDITVTNLTNGNHFTPILYTAHDSGSHLFEVGMDADSAIQAMAECGDLSGLTATYTADDDTIVTAPGTLLNPGANANVMIDTDMTGNTHLSIVAMILPTNDAFIGLDGLAVPTAAGTYTYYLNGYDAGTEANDELMDTSGCAAGMPGIPGAPGADVGMNGTGVAGADSNDKIHVHRGVLGDTNNSGGASDLNSTIHRWQNPVAKVTITVTP